MDNSSVASELLDSLDILRPPVTRILTNTNEDTIYGTKFNNNPNDIRFLRDFHKKLKCIRNLRPKRSTSLILKKTTEREIDQRNPEKNFNYLLQQNSLLNINKKDVAAKDKPLIKVTIIPKSINEQNSNKFRKRMHVNKANRLYGTTSNQENSIKTKDVYIVVAGKKREKIYEVKTTGSAKFADDKCSKIPHSNIKHITHLKHLLKSLNMDKRRKKQDVEPSLGYSQVEHYTIDDVRQNAELWHKCTCLNETDKHKDKDNIIGTHRSRIRIIGRLGLTEDDKYILQCATTVDGNPVSTNVSNAEPKLSPIYIPKNNTILNKYEQRFTANFDMTGQQFDNNENNSSRRRDTGIQTVFGNKDKNTHDYNRPEIYMARSTESQGTQVNICFPQNGTTFRRLNQNQIFQCKCCNTIDHQIFKSDNSKAEDDVVDGHSPLVIISVYPKQESDSPNECPCPSRKPNTNTKEIKEDLKLNHKKVFRRSRSPSPDIKRMENKQLKNKKCATSPNRQAGIRPFRMFNKENPDLVATAVVDKTKHTNKAHRETSNKNKRLVAESKSDFNKKGENSKTTSSKPLETKGINTEHRLTKKALINNYTKKLTERMNVTNQELVAESDLKPGNDVSNVTINIDGKDEYYDMLFRQGNLTTDLRVRKTIKERNAQKYCAEIDSNSASMENLLLVPDETEPRKRLFSQLLMFGDQSNITTTLNRPKSKLNVRDSIELSHRRDKKASRIMKNAQTGCNSQMKKNTNNNIIDLSGTIKHYKGDDCSIPDPIARDKEIRELLGVGNCQSNITKQNVEQEYITGPINLDSSFLWFPPQRRERILMSENKFYKCFCKERTGQHGTERTTTTNNNNTENNNTNNKHNDGEKPKDDTAKPASTQYKTTENVAGYHMILNHNVQVILHADQFTKQKPIMLTRSQYDRIKNVIQNSLSKKTNHETKRKTNKNKLSLVSVGDVRKKKKPEKILPSNKETQTQYSLSEREEDQPTTHQATTSKKPLDKEKIVGCKKSRTMILINSTEFVSSNENSDKSKEIPSRHSMSSYQIRYANVAYLKHVTFSSSHIEQREAASSRNYFPENNCHSLHTIFKGHKKSLTPNLGTSACSLFPENETEKADKSLKFLMPPREKKKPFLKRLMSCLVMRSEKTTEVKMAPAPREISANSSIDSYHISTSLGAIELSSSIYDTSASFYSNHTILPINNKMKRSFFSSVREFLTSRKS